MPKEVKQVMQVPLELKEIDADGHFVGYASIFNNIDSYRDIVMPGAFEKTIKKTKGIFPILADHDPYKQIGWNTEAEEDKRGLKVTGQLNMEVQLARERHSLAKQAKEIGGKSGLSIGYVTKISERDETKRTKKLLEVDLWEYSFVVFPANDKANVVRVKTLMENLGISVDYTEDPKGLELFLREVGFSNSESKKIANVAIALRRKEHPTDDLDLREVDPETVKKMIAQCDSIVQYT